MQFRRERVRVETQRHIIEGTLQLPNEGYRSRTTDFLNAHDSDFIALIDADVIWTDGAREPERQQFMAISARHVILVTELESSGRGRRARAGRGGRRGGGDLNATVCVGGRVVRRERRLEVGQSPTPPGWRCSPRRPQHGVVARDQLLDAG